MAIAKDESYFRQYGVIQMRTNDGSPKFFPLYDESDFASVPTDEVRNNKNWIGAIYYRRWLWKNISGRKYYTLFDLWQRFCKHKNG